MRSLEFDLTREKPSKTLDIGLNGTSISADPLGRVSNAKLVLFPLGLTMA